MHVHAWHAVCQSGWGKRQKGNMGFWRRRSKNKKSNNNCGIILLTVFKRYLDCSFSETALSATFTVFLHAGHKRNKGIALNDRLKICVVLIAEQAFCLFPIFKDKQQTPPSLGFSPFPDIHSEAPPPNHLFIGVNYSVKQTYLKQVTSKHCYLGLWPTHQRNSSEASSNTHKSTFNVKTSKPCFDIGLEVFPLELRFCC